MQPTDKHSQHNSSSKQQRPFDSHRPASAQRACPSQTVCEGPWRLKCRSGSRSDPLQPCRRFPYSPAAASQSCTNTKQKHSPTSFLQQRKYIYSTGVASEEQSANISVMLCSYARCISGVTWTWTACPSFQRTWGNLSQYLAFTRRRLLICIRNDRISSLPVPSSCLWQ